MEGEKEKGLEQVLNLIARAVTAVEGITELRKQKLMASEKEKEKEERLVAESKEKLYRISYMIAWVGREDEVFTGFFSGKDLLSALETAKSFLTGKYASGKTAQFSLIGATELCVDGDYDKFTKLCTFWALP